MWCLIRISSMVCIEKELQHSSLHYFSTWNCPWVLPASPTVLSLGLFQAIKIVQSGKTEAPSSWTQLFWSWSTTEHIQVENPQLTCVKSPFNTMAGYKFSDRFFSPKVNSLSHSCFLTGEGSKSKTDQRTSFLVLLPNACWKLWESTKFALFIHSKRTLC